MEPYNQPVVIDNVSINTGSTIKFIAKMTSLDIHRVQKLIYCLIIHNLALVNVYI